MEMDVQVVWFTCFYYTNTGFNESNKWVLNTKLKTEKVNITGCLEVARHNTPKKILLLGYCSSWVACRIFYLNLCWNWIKVERNPNFHPKKNQFIRLFKIDQTFSQEKFLSNWKYHYPWWKVFYQSKLIKDWLKNMAEDGMWITLYITERLKLRMHTIF